MNKVLTSTPVLYGASAIVVLVVGYLVYQKFKVQIKETAAKVGESISTTANEIKQVVTGETIVRDEIYPEYRGRLADEARKGGMSQTQIDAVNQEDELDRKRAVNYDPELGELGTIGA